MYIHVYIDTPFTGGGFARFTPLGHYHTVETAMVDAQWIKHPGGILIFLTHTDRNSKRPGTLLAPSLLYLSPPRPRKFRR